MKKMTGIVCNLLECRLRTTLHLIVMLRFVGPRVLIRCLDGDLARSEGSDEEEEKWWWWWCCRIKVTTSDALENLEVARN